MSGMLLICMLCSLSVMCFAVTSLMSVMSSVRLCGSRCVVSRLGALLGVTGMWIRVTIGLVLRLVAMKRMSVLRLVVLLVSVCVRACRFGQVGSSEGRTPTTWLS